jgi:hypothetical protein
MLSQFVESGGIVGKRSFMEHDEPRTLGYGLPCQSVHLMEIPLRLLGHGVELHKGNSPCPFARRALAARRPQHRDITARGEPHKRGVTDVPNGQNLSKNTLGFARAAHSLPPASPRRAFSIMSFLANPSRHSAGIPDSPQYAPASWPQTAPVVSASSPRFTVHGSRLWPALCTRLLTGLNCLTPRIVLDAVLLRNRGR